ncbi:uncharacterized protein LOC126278792 [Schistocerca gregaria]|uniref:uncharacterized protein LOC126278792 n=2 Tax=Schistocerca gregaria TaxID=7010 RepID=UPI00211EC81D|nr:uncharacterized protein LOC126278792 [Schistocerca gregaria]
MNYGAEEESKNGTPVRMKLLRIPVNGTDTTVSMELHTLKPTSGPNMKCLITYKNRIDAELLSENQDDSKVYYYEGGGTTSSSFSSLCADFQENGHEILNLAPRKSLCILLEKQCQTES